jgi:hypothetical protein
MLNYTEKTQNTYIQSLTVSELMTIENCVKNQQMQQLFIQFINYVW